MSSSVLASAPGVDIVILWLSGVSNVLFYGCYCDCLVRLGSLVLFVAASRCYCVVTLLSHVAICCYLHVL